MKKIIFILLITIAFISCSREKIEKKTVWAKNPAINCTTYVKVPVWLKYCLKNNVDTSIFRKNSYTPLSKDTLKY